MLQLLQRINCTYYNLNVKIVEMVLRDKLKAGCSTQISSINCVSINLVN
jgi:hypothetical protein